MVGKTWLDNFHHIFMLIISLGFCLFLQMFATIQQFSVSRGGLRWGAVLQELNILSICQKPDGQRALLTRGTLGSGSG